MSREPEAYAFAYDCRLRRPGCVLLQGVLGGTVPSVLFFELFDSADWLLGPTPDLKVYRATEGQLRFVAKMTRQREEA